MKLKAFPRYTDNGPSSRYRSYQYLPFFEEFNVEVFPFFDDSYSPTRSYNNPNGVLYLIKIYLRRLLYLLKLNSKDIVFVEYEFTPFLPFIILYFKLRGINYIVDYDDAIFHNYDQHKNNVVRKLFSKKIPIVIENAKCVITGSPYLTEFALKYNKNVYEIPTSIDFSKYSQSNSLKENSKFIIGWIGSSTTSKNLLALIPVFEQLLKEKIEYEIHAIGFNPSLENKFSELPFKNIKWETHTEVENIKRFSVGIMPLDDNLFNKGKCAFKLIQYMACGIPTISTPLEANVKVNGSNNNLFATSNEDWINCFKEIQNNRQKYHEVGELNREIIHKHYSIQANNKKYINIIKNHF